MIKKSINIILVFFILQTSIFSSVLPSEYKTERIGFIESTTNKIITIDGLGGDGKNLLTPVGSLTSIFPVTTGFCVNAPKPDAPSQRFPSTVEYTKTVLFSNNSVSNNTLNNDELRFKEKYRIYKTTALSLNIMPVIIHDPLDPYIPPWFNGDDPYFPPPISTFNPDGMTFTSNKLYYPNEIIDLMITNSRETGDNTYEAETFHTEPGATLYPVLIGYSQGGLLAYEYARQYSLSNPQNSLPPVSAVISYSSPLKGVKMLTSDFATEIIHDVNGFLGPIFNVLQNGIKYKDSEILKLIANETLNYISDTSNTEIQKVSKTIELGGFKDKITEFRDNADWQQAKDELYNYLISTQNSVYGLPAFITNQILNKVFNGASTSDAGVQDLKYDSNYMKNILLPQTFDTGAMLPKNQKARELIPTAYGAIIGTQVGRAALKDIVLSFSPNINLDKLSIDLKKLTNIFYNGFNYNVSHLLDVQSVFWRHGYNPEDGDLVAVIDCPKLNLGRLDMLDAFKMAINEINFCDPVTIAYKIFDKMNCEGLVCPEDQAIDSLNQAGESENVDIYGKPGGNLYNFARYKLGKVPIYANHESINNNPETTRKIAEMLINLDWIYELDKNNRIVRKGTFFPKDGKF